jgi:predicted AAA+ superfamily ATPase
MSKDLVRDIEQKVKRDLFEAGKVIVLYGPRQVGKTTFAKKILSDYNSDSGYLNCEENSVREVLMSGDSKAMYNFLGDHRVVVLDEAQTVPNIGRALKILIDAYPELNIIATGSSSFDLANKINEPLTGRHFEYFLPPLSFNEIARNFSRAELLSGLSERLIYGGYPEVLLETTTERRRRKLELLTTSYLYRDVLMFNNIKSPEILTKILQALARQVGGEVSYNEIAGLVGIDRKTVMSYIRLLEQAFVIFRLPPLMRNRRDELKKMPKFYFYDNGILNALINDFNGSEFGRDMGSLWENLMVSERLKYNKLHDNYLTSYYWRLKSGAEVDYVEEYNGELHPYEFKYNKNSLGAGAKIFTEEYDKKVKLVNKTNFADWLLDKEE